MNDADRAATRDAIRRRWEAPTPDYGIRMSKMAPSQYAATQALADDLLQARKDLAALLDENERLRKALEDVRRAMPNECTCSVEYTDRRRIDPSCAFHDYGDYVTSLIDAALDG